MNGVPVLFIVGTTGHQTPPLYRVALVLSREDTVFPFPLLALVHLLASHVLRNAPSFSKHMRRKAPKLICLLPWLLNSLGSTILFVQSLAEVHEF